MPALLGRDKRGAWADPTLVPGSPCTKLGRCPEQHPASLAQLAPTPQRVVLGQCRLIRFFGHIASWRRWCS